MLYKDPGVYWGMLGYVGVYWGILGYIGVYWRILAYMIYDIFFVFYG